MLHPLLLFFPGTLSVLQLSFFTSFIGSFVL
jgi:hypothetical protein